MIIEAGHFALILALLAALVQAGAGFAGAAQDRPGWMLMTRRAAGSLFGLVSIAFIALLHAYGLSDFSVKTVAENSHTTTPVLYKIAAAWGNHEGSMLLWVWMLSFWGFLAARAQAEPRFQARALAFQGLLAAGFALFVLFTSNPFLRLDPAAEEGLGFNPLLQDPAVALHPPLLYAGYVGFSIVFSFAAAALLEGRAGADFAARLRPWALAAFASLTAGITLGSFWAYYELGWGGFWFWDPVENASLLPWLAGAALLHAARVTQRAGGVLAGWTVFLALLAFSLSMLGTFLVRSGVLTSVHAFASDPARGAFILALLALYAGGGFALYAVRAPRLAGAGGFAPVSRESALLLNNVFLFTFCATVLTGTLYPLFMDALGLGAVAVGAPYYAAVLLPFLPPFALLMGAGPLAQPGGGSAAALLRGLWPSLAVGVAGGFFPAIAGLAATPFSVCGIGAGAFILTATLQAFLRARRRGWAFAGMIAAHAGFALLVLGATAATQWKQEKTLHMNPGDRVEIAGATLAFLGTETGLGPDYYVETGVFTLQDGQDASAYAFMTPENRWYPVAGQETRETAQKVRAAGVIYLVMGAAEAEGRVVRLYHHPLLLLIFSGAGLMALGAVLPLLERRRA